VRLLLDVSAVPEQLTGAGVYTTELARALARCDGVDLVLASRTDDSERWRVIAPTADLHAVAARTRPARLVWEQTLGPRLADKLSVDLWHGPHYTMPVRVRVPAVVTVHDLTFFDHPEWHERTKVAFFRRAITESGKRAAALVCVSDATADRLRDAIRPRGDVVVVHHGVDTDRFTPHGDESDDRPQLAALGVTEPYVAFAGTIEPRKNVPALVAAFARVAGEYPSLRLVLAGKPGWHTDAIDRAIAGSGAAERVVRTGYVPADTLPALLRRASAVVYPSHEEGFGLPPLEAMACGTPVLTTADVAAARLLGDAVVTAASDPEALADGLREVLEPATAARLRTAGPAAVAGFSWAEAARRHVAVYRAALERGPGGGRRVAR